MSRSRLMATTPLATLLLLLPLLLPAASAGAGFGCQLEGPLALSYSHDHVANVILIHGIRQREDAWDRWKGYLEEDSRRGRVTHRVWRFDYPWSSVTAVQAAQELAVRIGELELQFRDRPLTLVGFSKGGLVARAFGSAPARQIAALEARGVRVQDTTLIYLDAPLRGCRPVSKGGLEMSDWGGSMTPKVTEELRRGVEGAAPRVYRSYAAAPRGGSGVVAQDSSFDSRLTFTDTYELDVETLRSEVPERTALPEAFDDHSRTMKSRSVYRRVFGEVRLDGGVQGGWIRIPAQLAGGTVVRAETSFFAPELDGAPPPAALDEDSEIEPDGEGAPFFRDAGGVRPPWVPPSSPPEDFGSYPLSPIIILELPRRTSLVLRMTRSAEWMQAVRISSNGVPWWQASFPEGGRVHRVLLENPSEKPIFVWLEVFHRRPAGGWLRSVHSRPLSRVEGRVVQIGFEDGSYSSEDMDFDDIVMECEPVR